MSVGTTAPRNRPKKKPRRWWACPTRPPRRSRRSAARRASRKSYALRLKVQGGGCSGFSYDLYFDQPQETDQSFDVKGVKLICDQMSLMYLMGTEIDYVEGLHGAGFKFNNPNVKSTCGCGSSFSVYRKRR